MEPSSGGEQYLNPDSQRILDSIPGFLMVINHDYSIALTNKALREVVGQDPGAKGLSCYQIFHHRNSPCDGTEHPCPLKDVIASKKIITVEHTHIDALGNELIVEIAASPVFDDKNNVIQIIETQRDITKGKQTEKELLEAKKDLRTKAAERTADLIVEIINHEKTNAELQKSMKQLDERVKELNCLYGLSHLFNKSECSLEEMLQQTAELIPNSWQYPEITCVRITLKDKEFKTANYQETAWKQTSPIIVQGQRDGAIEVCYLEERPTLVDGPFSREEVQLLFSVAERLGKKIAHKRVEIALQKSEQRFRSLVENSIIGISIFQGNQVVYQNPTQENLLGPLPRKSLLTDWENIHPDDVEKVRENYQKIVAGENQTLDMDFRFYPPGRKQNKVDMKWVYCQTTKIEYQGVESILVHMMDITRAKELERIVTIQDKMGSLGRIATGIAHEIRNPLSTINVYLSALKRITPEKQAKPATQDISDVIAEMEKASHKIESVVKRVMDFARPGLSKVQLTSANQCIKRAIDLSTTTLRKSGVTLETSLDDNLPKCYLDSQLIEQLMLNLITNAVEALKEHDNEKIIKITTSIKKKNKFITITVSDSGPGVPHELKDKIFEPFFTTKHYGSGVGLTLCQRIASDHHGHLDVATNSKGGADFIVELPVKKKATNR